jgi:hypothetical protein
MPDPPVDEKTPTMWRSIRTLLAVAGNIASVMRLLLELIRLR